MPEKAPSERLRGIYEATWGMAAVFVRIGAGLLLLPIIITQFTISEVALWYLLQSVAAVGTLMDFGFGPTIARAASAFNSGSTRYMEEGLELVGTGRGPNLVGVRELAVTAERLYWWLAVAGAAVSSVVGYLTVAGPNKHADGVESPFFITTIFTVATAFGLYSRVYNNIIYGIGFVVASQRIAVIATASYLGCAIVIVTAGGGLLGLALTLFVAPLVDRVLSRQALCRAIGDWSKTESNGLLMQALWPNSWRVGVMWLGSFMVVNVTVLVVGNYCSSVDTAAYGISNQLINVASQVGGVLLAVKTPTIIALRMKGDLKTVRAVFVRRLVLCIVAYSLAGALIWKCGHLSIRYISSSATLLPPAALAFFLLIRLLEFVHVQHATVTLTENRVPFTWMALAGGVATVVLALWLTPQHGVWGVLIAAGVAQLATNNWYVVYRAWKGLLPSRSASWKLQTDYGHS